MSNIKKNLPSPCSTTARLTLTGVEMLIGYDKDNIAIQMDEMQEPIFMSHGQAKLLIAAIDTAIHDSQEH